MTTTTTEREAKPCWVLVFSDGTDLDTGDCIPHYATEEEAAEEASTYTSPGLGTPKPRQLDNPCFEISGCVCCGESFGDNYGGEHFDSRADAEKGAENTGWVLAEDGTATCDECVKGCDCNEGETL